jgi:hypothetical protein
MQKKRIAVPVRVWIYNRITKPPATPEEVTVLVVDPDKIYAHGHDLFKLRTGVEFDEGSFSVWFDNEIDAMEFKLRWLCE